MKSVRTLPPFLFSNAESGGDPAPTTTEGTPAGAQAPTPEIPDGYVPEDRYKEAQAWGTRSSQEASQLRQENQAYKDLLSDDADTRREAAQILGLELAEDEDDTQYTDPNSDALQKRIDQLEQKLNGDLQQRAQQQEIARIEQESEKSMDTLQVPEDETVRNLIVSRAISLPPNAQGLLDVEKAFEEFKSMIDSQKKTWATSKRTQHFSPGGSEGTQALDLTTPEGRMKLYASRLQNDEGIAS